MFLPVAAIAQNAVSGRVTDENGAPLPGAQIIVLEQGIRTSTNSQGEFVLPSLPAGEATIEVIYLGLPTTSQTITVTDGARTTANIVFPAARAGDVIVVRGTIGDSTARALNQQRTADNTTNVVSADAIGRFPDYNIAEALQRVPGIGVERDQGEGNFISLRGAPSEFTAITIDGVSIPSSSPDTRALDLGTIPSDVVNSLEISKTLLPDQDADSIAGAVNLVTRSPFDNPRLRVTASAGLSHNELGNTNDYRASGVISDVIGNFGALLSGSYSKTDRRVDNIESVWGVIRGDGLLGVPEQEFKDYDTRRERIALTGAFEIRPDDVHQFYVRGTYSKRSDNEFRNLLGLIYEDGTLQPGATEQAATFNRARYIKEFRHRIVNDELMSFNAGGISNFEDFTIDYSGAYSRAEQTYPRRQQLVYRGNLRPNLSYDFRNDPNEPEVSIFRTQEHLNLDSYDFRQTTVRSQDTIQDELAFAFNIDIPTTLFSVPASYKFGARVRLRDVTSDEENNRDRRAGSAPSGSLASLLSNEPSQNFGYFLGNKFNSSRVIDYFRSVEQSSAVPETRRVPQSTEGDYSASENIYAGYGMTRIDFSNARLILGLRVERTEFEGAAPNFNQVTETFTLNQARNNYTSWFPNATLRYEFNDNLIGRLALTRAISRPNYRDNVPRISENSDSAGTIVQVSQGNPDLQPTMSNNLDAGLEYYFRPVGLLSANVFYKDLKDYEFTVVANGVFDGRAALITRKDNASNGRAYGFELAYQQQFTFLPGALSGFGAFANYTWTKASIDLPASVPGRIGRSPLPNQSRHTVNLSLFYETNRFNARVSYTDRSDYIDEFSSNPLLDTIWEGREQIDFTTSFDVTNQLNVFFEAKNLTNTPGVRYAGVRERVTEFEKFGATYFLGARFNF